MGFIPEDLALTLKIISSQNHHKVVGKPPEPILLVPEEKSLYVTFRLPRILREAGFPVHILCQKGNWLQRSRYVDLSIPQPSQTDVFNHLTSLLEKELPGYSKLILGSEPLVRRLLQHQNPSIRKSWQPGILHPWQMDLCLGKFKFHARTKEHGLETPEGRICHDLEDLLDFTKRVNWPVVVKTDQGSGGDGVRMLLDEKHARAWWNIKNESFLAQAYIRGRRGVVDMICSKGKPLGWLASYSIHQAGGPFGPSTARLFKAMPSLDSIVRKVAESTGFDGFCGFDWIQQEGTNRYFLIEFHPRPPSGFRFGRFCGVPFSDCVETWIQGGTPPSTSRTQPPGTEVLCSYFSADLNETLRTKNWRKLKNWLPWSRSRHDIFVDDPMLMATWLYSKTISYMKKSKVPKMPR